MVKAPGPVPSAKKTTKKRVTKAPAELPSEPVGSEDGTTEDVRTDESVAYVTCEEVEQSTE